MRRQIMSQYQHRNNHLLAQMSYSQRGETIRFDRDKSLASQIPALRTVVDAIHGDKLAKIINSSGYQLGQMLNNNETTSVELVKIFCFRAGTIGKDLNAITDDNFGEAIKAAEECDRLRAQKGWKNARLDSEGKDQFPPLFGIPLSLKDAIDIKGLPSTVGLIERYNRKEEKDGGIVAVLKASGMIPFVKSNMPQLGLTYQSSNSMFGSVKNPWDRSRTSGGSTGGQAALLAARSTIMGIGSDVGGSLRNPAEFCGIYSLKGCTQRWIFLGHAKFAPSISGQTNIKVVMGPMTRCVDDLACFANIMGNETNYAESSKDPYKQIIPFNYKVYKSLSEKPQKLRIGYFDSVEIFPTSKASKRAVHEVVGLLKEQGHTLVPIKVPRVEDIVDIMVSSVVAEGGLKGFREMLEGQPLSQMYSLMNISSKLPKFLVWAISKALKNIKPRFAATIWSGRELSSHEYLKIAHKLQCVKRDFIQMWRTDKLDLIISPGFSIQAPKLGMTNDLGPMACVYNFMWNVLDLPAGAMPVTLSREDQQAYESQHNDPFNSAAIRSQQGAVGLPVGIQVVALPFEQEKVLGLMKNLQTLIGFSAKHPYPI